MSPNAPMSSVHRRKPGARPAAADFDSLRNDSTLISKSSGRIAGRGAGGTVTALLLAWFAVLAVFTSWRHESLPAPIACGNGLEFSECEARITIRELAHDIGMRLVGTKQEGMAKDLILEKLYALKRTADATPGMPVFDIDVQRADGSHRFDLMGHALIKTYTNVTNVIARLSCGPECDSQAILLNSHFDSTIVSPGAADDGVGVAVMLELIRILSQRPVKGMRNAVVFLWNGAEETLQDASHAFITQHPYRSSIRAVINLEAMGQGGKEILFQANSKEMINAYSRVPHPHGSVLSNDIFRTGLVMSDTDFRQFVEHGDLVGLDLAFYTGSYLYHTMLDVEDTIEPGSIQNFGENSMAMLEYLLYESDLNDIKRDNDLIFFDLLGLKFVHYTWGSAHMVHWIVIGLAIGAVLLRRAPLAHTVKATASAFASNIGSILSCLVLGISLLYGIRTPMVWYSKEWYPVVLFAPVGLIGSLLPQAWLRSKSHAVSSRTGDYNLERAVYDGVLLQFAILIALTDRAQLGITYIFTFYAVALLVGKIVDWTLRSQARHIHPLAYFVAALPFAITTELSIGTLNLFVPITGRTGPDAPADVIVGVLTGALLFLHSFLILPLAHRFSARDLGRIIKGLALLSLVVTAFFVTQVKPFDVMHPKRLFVSYKENISDNTRELLIAHADPGPMKEIVAAIVAQTGKQPTLRPAEETGRDWSTVAPFSNFMESYAFDVSHLAPISPARPPGPQLTVVEDTYDAETDTRRLALRCRYPGYIWTILTFKADVVAWSLDDRTMLNNGGRDAITLRHAGGYPTNAWALDMTVRGRGKLSMELSGLEQDTFHELVDENGSLPGQGDSSRKGSPVGSALGGVGVGKAWKWSERFGSAKVLAAAESVMPDWTTGLYIATVVSRLEI
ncbi:hypothetical protein HDU89_005756 [Geranomyces variabilis]|nr:hypothetical protein HDU89_005756 [Geranomyces variabilis]